MRSFETVLLNGKLSLEEIDGVLEIGILNAEGWHSMLFVVVCTHQNQFIELVDQIVDAGLQHC